MGMSDRTAGATGARERLRQDRARGARPGARRGRRRGRLHRVDGRRGCATPGSRSPPSTSVTGFPECLDGRVKTLHPRVHAGILADLRLPDHVRQLEELGIAAVRARGGQPLPVRGDGRLRRGARRVRRADRHRRADDGPRRRQELPLRRRGRRAGRRTPTSSPPSREGGTTLEQRRRLARPGLRAHGGVRRGCRLLVLVVLRPGRRGARSRRSSARRGSGRRCCATARTRTRARRCTSAARRATRSPPPSSCTARRCPTTTTSTPTPRCGPRTTTATGRRSRSSSTPTRAASPSAPTSPRPTARRTPATRSRRSAASSPPTGRSSLAMAEQVAEVFTEVVVAPAYEDGAVEVLSRKPSIRLLRTPGHAGQGVEFRQVCGGVLLQQADSISAPGDDPATWTLATGEAADEALLADLAFAWRAVRAVKSNAILLAQGGATVGVGMGQVNRVDAARLAVRPGGGARRRLGRGLRRVLPVPRRPAGAARRRRARGRPAGRLGARRGGRRGRAGRRRDAVPHGHPPLRPLACCAGLLPRGRSRGAPSPASASSAPTSARPRSPASSSRTAT